MKIKFYSLILILIISTLSHANYLDENVTKMKWNDLEVVWLEDNQLPTYEIAVYFGEGSYTEKKSS